MAAGLGFKTFTTGEVLTAADTNGYLMQGVNVFADAAARTAAITSPQEGQMSYLKDTNATEYYTGSAWTALSSSSPASASSYIATGDGSNSTSFTGMVTPQAVTLTTGTKVMIVMTAKCETDAAAGRKAFMGYAISGATTVAASEGKAIAWTNRVASTSNVYDTHSAIFFETVTAGSNTFTLNVKVSGGSSYFQERQLLVIDLGS